MMFFVIVLLAMVAWQLHGIRQELIESNQRLRSLRIAMQAREQRPAEDASD